MFTRLIESLSATEALSQVFSDEVVLQCMLDFEAALARAEARAGLIPPEAADAITRAAVAEGFDIAELVRQAGRAGTPAIPLVRMLTERVRAQNAAAAGFVHWGATSQDVTDTAMVLLLNRCRQVLTLRKIYGLSQKQIAAQLGIAEHTVEAQVGNGMRGCAKFLARHGLP